MIISLNYFLRIVLRRNFIKISSYSKRLGGPNGRLEMDETLMATVNGV